MKPLESIWGTLKQPKFKKMLSEERNTRIQFTYQNILVGCTNIIAVLFIAIYLQSQLLLIGGILGFVVILISLQLIKNSRHHTAVHLINLFFTAFLFMIPFSIGNLQLVPASFLVMLITTSLAFKNKIIVLAYLVFFCICGVVYIYLLEYSPYVLKLDKSTNFVLNSTLIIVLITYIYFADIFYKRIYLLQQQQLKITEQRYKVMVSNIDDMLLILDEKGKIEYASPSVEKTIGYSAEEMIGEKEQDNLHPEDRKAVLDIYEANAKDLLGKTINQEYRVKKKNGEWIWCDCSITFYKDEVSRQIKLIKVGRDITEKKSVAQALEQKANELNVKNKELKKYIDSNMQLENFAYFASHDLKEPLRTIVGFSQLLEKRYKSTLDQTGQEFLNFIIKAANDMNVLIGDLLEYSRVNTPNEEVHEIDLKGLLENVVANVQNLIEEKKGQVSWNELPPTILGNPVKLKQLFQNLIANALKFNRPEESPSIEINVTDEAQYWQVAVSDNGIGIDPEFHEKIFLIFKKLHSKAEYDGTGIGLALCKKIVEQHKGKIWLESTPGQGTTFYFTLSKNFIGDQS